MRRLILHIAPLWLAGAFAFATQTAHAHPSWRNLGGYERAALSEANGGRALDFEPAPEGKIIASIRIVNLNVFPRRSSMSWGNVFHMTTTRQAVRQELTFARGDKFRWQGIKESLRLLRDPFYANVAVIVPLRSQQAGHIDVFVVTRDRWSIRPNAQFELQDGTVSSLDMLPAENNFLGRRKRLALEIIADLGEYSFGPRYIDPNVLGKRYRLDLGAAMIFNRSTDQIEGSKLDTRLEYPLWELDRRWGGHVTVDYKNFVFRQFQGQNVLIWEADIPYEYRMRRTSVETEVVRQLGSQAKHRIAMGHRLNSIRPTVRSDFNGDASQRLRFETEVLPRSERTSALFLRYEVFKPTFVTYRNIDNYDLPEEIRIGPRATAEVSQSLQLLGSESDFLQLGASIGWWVDFKKLAYMDASAAVTTRFAGGELADNDVRGAIKLATGRFLRRQFRVVARGEVALRFNDLNNVLLFAGGETGLRGYQIGAFTGKARAVGNVELRSMPRKIGFAQIGGMLFWDSGHAAETLGQIRLQNDVGFGVRLLIPQVSSELFRVDIAFPLQGRNAGSPRFTGGFNHIF